MKALFLLLLMASFASSEILPLGPKLRQQMRAGGSYRSGCPVALDSLRQVKVRYHDFANRSQRGSLIVHAKVAREVEEIFETLYKYRYPIHSIAPIYRYKGSDFSSIEHDNTAAFNCRKATGSRHFSKHAYGLAIDINPIENPYVFRSGRSSHRASKPYLNRHNPHPALIGPKSKIIKLFASYGWRWGGSWKGAKDYQHFYKP